MKNSRALLASRFELTATYKSSHYAASWLGHDVASGAPVRLVAVDAREVSRYEKLIGARQFHLSSVVAVLPEVTQAELGAWGAVQASQAVVVVEYVAGATLHRHLHTRGRLEPFKAVAWILRLIGALEAMHQRGVPHGGLNPRSVIVEPVGRVIPPVLVMASAPVLAAYCSPERIRGAEPSTADDVWALLSTAYRMVTGEAPFNDTEPRVLLAEVSRGRPRSLQECGVEDPELQRVFDAAFEPNERQRLSRLDELRKALDRWEREESPVIIPRAAPSRAVPRLGALTLGAVAAPSTELVYGDRLLPLDEGAVPGLEAAVEMGGGSAPAITGGKSAPDASRVPESRPGAGVGTADAPSVTGVGMAPHRARVDSVAAQLSARRMREGRKSWLLLGVPVVLAAVGVAYMEYGDELGLAEKGPPAAASEQREPAARTSPNAVTKDKRVRTGGSRAERLTRCVESYFPAGVFADAASFEFLCEGGDFRHTTTRLFGMARAAQGALADAGTSVPPSVDVPSGESMSDAGVLIVKSSLNPAQRELDLGWYELVAAAMARSGCCDTAPSIDLPETKGWCMQLEKAVRQVVDDSRKPGDLSPTIRVFDEAVECLFANQIPRAYAYELRPTVPQRAMLQRFLTRAAENEAKRASGR